MEAAKTSRRGLKICCGVTIIFIIILLIVLLVLFLTILKPKQPEVQAHPVSLQHIQFVLLPQLKLNITLGITVTIKNRNYGGFKYVDSVASVYYHGDVVAEAPIKGGMMPARASRNISTSLVIIADKLISSPYFWIDIGKGSLNLTSSSTMHGKASFLKIMKKRATAATTCDIWVFLEKGSIDSDCHSKLHI